MKWTEPNSLTDQRSQRIEYLNQRFSGIYRKKIVGGRSFFFPKTGNVFAFAVDYIGKDCLVLEYAETGEDLNVMRLEDGDSFPMTMPENKMFEAMVHEIES